MARWWYQYQYPRIDFNPLTSHLRFVLHFWNIVYSQAGKAGRATILAGDDMFWVTKAKLASEENVVSRICDTFSSR